MRRALAVLAAGVVGAVLPMPAAGAAQGFGGFTADATATPLNVSIYEPTIPIPSEPQAELDLAYTHTEATSGPSASGRASWLWPGDAVGEGFKTFAETLGLPKQVGQRGYPVQVNSQTPGGPSSQSDEPVPGTVMHTRTSSTQTSAEVGLAPDGNVGNHPKKGGKPGAPQPPSPGGLARLAGALSGRQDTAAPKPKSPGLPPQLAALVDAGGTTSLSRSTYGGSQIGSTAVSGVSDLSLLGGLITADSVRTTVTSHSDARRAGTNADSHVVGLAIAGNAFTIGRDGVSAVGHQAAIPGLPDQADQALKALGLSFVLPQGKQKTHGANGSSAVQGLQLVVDTGKLRSRLDSIPFDQLVNLIPNQAGQLKSVAGAVAHLSPRIVITAGNATVDTGTVPGISLPGLGAGAPPATMGGSPTAGSGVSGALGGAPSGAPPSAGAPPTGTGGAAPSGSAVATRNAAAGLPPLASVPGALIAGALVIASGVGFWLQKIGGFVIGGAGSCSHGLESGIPDLRKG